MKTCLLIAMICIVCTVGMMVLMAPFLLEKLDRYQDKEEKYDSDWEKREKDSR